MLRRSPLLAVLFLAACGGSTTPSATDAGPSDSGLAPIDAGFCPSLSCSDLDLGGGASATRYDPSSHVLTLVLSPSAEDVLSGSVSFMVGKMGAVPSTQSALLSVSGKSLSADLTRWLTSDVVFFGALSITMVAACHSTSTIGNVGMTTMPGANGITVSAFSCL